MSVRYPVLEAIADPVEIEVTPRASMEVSGPGPDHLPAHSAYPTEHSIEASILLMMAREAGASPSCLKSTGAKTNQTMCSFCLP